MPLAIGLTLGLLIPALAVIGTFYLRRRILERRGRRKATPPHHTLPEKGDQLSGAPQESKRQPQHTQSPTHGSTLSSSAPTAAAIPTTAISIPESGMPPSHLGLTFPVGGSSRSGEVAKTNQATPVEVIEILDEDDEQLDERPRPPPWWDVSQSRGTQR